MGLLRSLKWILLVPIPFPCSSCGAANSSQLPLLLAIALSPKEDSSPGGYAFPPWFSQFAKGWPSYLKVRPRQKPGSCWDHIIACLLPLPPHLLRSPLPSEFLLTKSHAPESPPPTLRLCFWGSQTSPKHYEWRNWVFENVSDGISEVSKFKSQTGTQMHLTSKHCLEAPFGWDQTSIAWEAGCDSSWHLCLLSVHVC